MTSALLYVGSCTGFLPYVRRPAGTGISAFRIDVDTGRSEALGITGDIANPTFAAVSPDGRSLCAISEIAGEADGEISAYAIDRATGALTLVSRRSSAGFTPAHLGFSPDGRYVAVANYADVPAAAVAGSSLAIFPRAADGSLGALVAMASHAGTGPDAVRQDRPHAHCVRFTPDGSHVFVADLGIDRVVAYRFDGTSLARQAEAVLAPGSGPRHFAFPADGPGLYVINELANSVTTLGSRFEPRADEPLLRPGFAGKAYASALVLSPDRRHLFAALRGPDEIVRLDLGADGIARTTARLSCGGATPRDMGLDPSGRLLAVANQDSDSVSLFRQAQGELTPLAQIATGSPMAIAFHPELR